LLSAIQQVLPEVPLPKKLASMRFDVWVSRHSLPLRMTPTPESVQLKLSWADKSMRAQRYVSIDVHALGLFEQCQEATAIPEQN